jgi:hypothetical protein
MPSLRVAVIRSGPLPVMRYTILTSSPTGSGTGANGSAHSSAPRAVPCTSMPACCPDCSQGVTGEGGRHPAAPRHEQQPGCQGPTSLAASCLLCVLPWHYAPDAALVPPRDRDILAAHCPQLYSGTGPPSSQPQRSTTALNSYPCGKSRPTDSPRRDHEAAHLWPVAPASVAASVPSVRLLGLDDPERRVVGRVGQLPEGRGDPWQLPVAAQVRLDQR